MKRTYIAPSFIIVDLKPRQILAASVGMFGTNATGEGMGREYDDDIEDEDSWW